MRSRTMRRLEESAAEWHRASVEEGRARVKRDAAIVAALREKAGVREVARIVNLNPNTVLDVRRRGEEA